MSRRIPAGDDGSVGAIDLTASAETSLGVAAETDTTNNEDVASVLVEAMDLPKTGSSGNGIVRFGLLLIALGMVVLVMSRRRVRLT